MGLPNFSQLGEDLLEITRLGAGEPAGKPTTSKKGAPATAGSTAEATGKAAGEGAAAAKSFVEKEAGSVAEFAGKILLNTVLLLAGMILVVYGIMVAVVRSPVVR